MGHEGRFSIGPLPAFSTDPCEQFWHGQACPLFDVVHPAFRLPTTASPTLQDALKDDFGEAVVACDMPEPSKFLSLDSCQKRLQWTHKEVYLAPHSVGGLVLQVGDAEKFPQVIIIIINPLTAGVFEAPQMILQPVFSNFPCSPLPSSWDLPNSRPVHSLMLSSHLFLCPPSLLPPFTVPCKMVLARPDQRET